LSKIILAKRNSVIFLSALLVLGTLTTILPTVQSQQYYEDRYNPADYQSYQDNRDYKFQKDSSVSINKIKCINNNFNVNGNNTGDINVGNKGQKNLGANAHSNGYYEGYGNNKQGKNFDCIINNNNNNNNTNIVSTGGGRGNQTILPIPTETPKSTTTLSVRVTIECIPRDTTFESAQACNRITAEILPNQFDIEIDGNNPNPDSFDGSIVPIIVTLEPGNFSVTIITPLSVVTTINNIESALGVDISQDADFTGHCRDPIVTGESLVCNIEQSFKSTSN
jgi:hypothetical protein